MSPVRKIGDEYYIEFMARGLKYQQRAGTDRAAAERLLVEVESKIRQGEMGVIVRDADVDIFLKDFAAFSKKEYPDPTVRRFDRALKHFAEFLHGRAEPPKKLSQVTPSVLEEYRALLLKGKRNGKPLQPALINLTLILLEEFFEYARKTGYLNDNPMFHIRLVPGEAGMQTQPVAEDGRPEEQFLLWTGCRVSELQGLQWSDVDWKGGVIVLPGRKFPLDYRLKDLLTGLKNSAGKSTTVFGDFSETAGLSQYRDVFACRYLQKNPSLFSLGKLLAVQDVARLLKYTECLKRNMYDEN